VKAAALATALLALVLAAPLDAQQPAVAPLFVTVAPVTLAPGGRAEAKVTLEILKDYRIVAPGSEGRYLQPAALSFNAAEGVYVEPAAWPQGKGWHAEPDGPPIKIFEGKVELKVTVHAGAKVAARSLTLQGRLRYQAVRGDGDFKKAATVEVKLPVTVAAPPAKPAAATRP